MDRAQQQFITARVLVIKRALLRAVHLGLPLEPHRTVAPPATISSWLELKHYCETAKLGGLGDAETYALAEAVFGTPDTYADACDEIRHQVDRWIRGGHLTFANSVFAEVLVPEQVDCLLGPDRGQEARDMLDDLAHRVGIEPGRIAALRRFLEAEPSDECV